VQRREGGGGKNPSPVHGTTPRKEKPNPAHVTRTQLRKGSVVHESGTPYCELGYLGFFAGLGRTGFTGLTPVIARVHIILLESMQFNVKSQNQETLSYI
jgi:hypothetical protein